MRWFPNPPPSLASGTVKLRYEDVTQDGRLILHTMPTAVGQVAWPALLDQYRDLIPRQPLDGVLPILTRLVVEGGDGPLSVHAPLQAETTHAFAHALDEFGEVDRLYLNMWVTLSGVAGNTHGFAIDNAGAPLQAGRVFAEHVFTRPFASPAERKVRRLAIPGLAHPPGPFYAARSGAEVLAPPEGYAPLDSTLVPDETPVVFGLAHTDSNQHVNSLVYPRYFEDAALRRLATHGVTRLLGRHAEILFRKPLFAGQTARWTLQTFAGPDKYCVVGTLAEADKPNTYCRLFF